MSDDETSTDFLTALHGAEWTPKNKNNRLHPVIRTWSLKVPTIKEIIRSSEEKKRERDG
jgi:hypothetical protein